MCPKTLAEYEAMEARVAAETNAVLASKPEAWFWCLHCERVCRCKEMLPDFTGARAACPRYKECGGCGIGVDMHEIQPDGTFFGGAKGPPPGALTSGQVIPLYPEKTPPVAKPRVVRAKSARRGAPR